MKYDNFSENNGQFRQKIDNEDVVLSYISSEVANWRYVSIVPQSMFWEKTEYIKRITFITILSYLILGILLAFVLAKKNYSPLAELIKRITASEGKSVNEVKNEYSFIASSITSNVIENKKISEKLEQQMKTLRQNFIIRLIKGHCRNIPLNETAATYNVELYTDNFAVMVFLIEDFRKMFDGIEKDASSKDIDLIYYAVQNIVEELVNTRHSGYAPDIDGMIVCLVNFKDGTKDEQKKDVFDIAKKAKHFIEKELYINLTVAIGSIETSMININSSYENALEAMDHKLLNRQGEIIKYEELQDSPNDTGIYYTLDMEYQFINSIKIGDFKKSEIILREIIDGAFNASISISMARCLMFDIVSTMIKVVNELSVIYDSEFMKTLNPVENLMKCKTFDGLKDEIILILECVSEYIDVNKKSHNSDLKDKIIEYVQENYWDTNLSIAFIAETFDMNPRYLSRFYKEQTGGALLDFIHKTRIKHAKSLLENDNYSVSETALEVGFYDSTAFIRAFKKYEGITPGKYKDGFLN